MKNLSFILIATLMFNSLALGTANAAETVKSATTSAATAAKGTELTKEELQNGATKSPYPACGNLLMVEESAYKKNEAYWKARGTSCNPSVANCNMKVQMIPDSGIFGSRAAIAGKNYSGTVPVGAFLETVRQRAATELAQGIQRNETIQKNCLSGKSSADASCKTSVANIRSGLEKETPGIRAAIALMRVPSDKEVDQILATKDITGLINTKLDPKFSPVKFPALAALTSEEQATAKKYYEELMVRIQKDFDASNAKILATLKGQERKKREVELNKHENKVVAFRLGLERAANKKIAEYMEAVGRVPQLVYVDNPKATDAALAAGMTAMIKDSKEVLADIKKNPTKKEDVTAAEVSKSVLQYASYGRLINTMLEEEAVKGASVSSCATATAALNQLRTAQGRTDAAVGGGVAVAAIGTAVLAPWALGLAGVGTATAGAVATNLAVAAGLIGGVGMTTTDVLHAESLAQNARVGLTSHEDAVEARDSAGIGVLMSPLDFMGGGAAFAAGATGAALLAKKTVSTVGRFAANTVASGEVKAAAVAAKEVQKAADKAAAAAAKAIVAEEKAAKAAATTAEKNQAKLAAAEATKASEAVEALGGKAAKELLGRKATATDEKTFSQLAAAGFLGVANAPHAEMLKEYAEITKGMSAEQLKHYGEQVEKITKVSGPIKTTGKETVEQTARNKEVALAALDMADGPEASAAILKADSGWDSAALAGRRGVREYARSIAKKTKEGVTSLTERARTMKKALAKAMGKAEDSEEVKQICICEGSCPIKVASSEFPDLKEPVYMACVSH